MSFFWHYHAYVIVLFLALGLLTALANTFFIRRLDQFPRPAGRLPRVSILVPARNEAANIEACVSSLLAQAYPDFEVLVLDDHSTDATRAILERLASENPRLRVLEGGLLPSGWLGKHWACDQLSRAASGELLLFTDADTQHFPGMLMAGVSALTAEQADLVTAFPYEQAVTWGEKLLVPVISFGIFSFLPVPLVRRLGWPSLSITIGQFMLFRRSAYEAVGGFAAVRNHLVDDVALGRRLISAGFRWRLLDGTRQISCRMYRGFWDAVAGFSKSVFAVFDYHVLFYLLVWGWVGVAFIEPVLVLLARALGMDWIAPFPQPLAVLAVAQSLALWAIAYRRFGFPTYLLPLYPLSLILFTLVALRSMVLTMTGQATWKGRALERPAWRL